MPIDIIWRPKHAIRVGLLNRKRSKHKLNWLNFVCGCVDHLEMMPNGVGIIRYSQLLDMKLENLISMVSGYISHKCCMKENFKLLKIKCILFDFFFEIIEVKVTHILIG